MNFHLKKKFSKILNIMAEKWRFKFWSEVNIIRLVDIFSAVFSNHFFT